MILRICDVSLTVRKSHLGTVIPSNVTMTAGERMSVRTVKRNLCYYMVSYTLHRYARVLREH